MEYVLNVLFLRKELASVAKLGITSTVQAARVRKIETKDLI